MLIGALSYVTFVAANIHYNMIALYSSSALMGVGASVLWTAQGVFTTNCAVLHERAEGLEPGSTLGVLNGIFFAIFQSNQLLGNLLAAALFKAEVATSTIFVVMTCICACGALTLIGLNDPPIADAEDGGGGAVEPATTSTHMSHAALDDSTLNSGSTERESQRRRGRCCSCVGPLSVFSRTFSALKLLGDVRMLVLLPLMVYSGLSQTFIFGSFPPLILERSTKFFVLACVGGVDAAASALLGRMSDRYGRVPVLFIGFLAAGGAALFLLLRHAHLAQGDVYTFFLVGSALGVSDAAFNTQVHALLGSWFPVGFGLEQAFANFKLFQAGSIAVFFLLDGQMGFGTKCVVTGSGLLAAVAALAAFDLAARARGVRGSVLDRRGAAEPGSTDLAAPFLAPERGAYGCGKGSLDSHSVLDHHGHSTRSDSFRFDPQGKYAVPDM